MTTKQPLEIEKNERQKVLLNNAAKLNLKPFDERIDDIIASVSVGRFQAIAFLAVAGGINAFNLIFYNMAYMELVPRFRCSWIGSDESFSCTEQDFC